MSLYADDSFLDVIVHQAQVAYATQQLNSHRKELQCRQAHERSAADALEPRVQHELRYCTQQVARWEDYLLRLEQGAPAIGSAPALNVLLRG
jgi:hypothetical protein